jgi:hypothetical protein
VSSYPTCPTCGEPAAPLRSNIGAKLGEHTPGGLVCRQATKLAEARRWAEEADRRGLVRVTGPLISDLSQRMLPVYGPYYVTAADVEAERRAAGWEKVQRRPGVATAAYFPRWAVLIEQALGGLSGGCQASQKEAAFRRAEGNEEFAAAVAAAADLAETKAEARKAVAALCKAADK